MARIRSLKPSFWSDPAVSGLCRDARLLCVGLISFADDEGRFLASPNAINGYVFPNDHVPNRSVIRWRDEIAAAHIIELYTAEGVELGYFRNWKKHQRINRPTPSVLPSPERYQKRPES